MLALIKLTLNKTVWFAGLSVVIAAIQGCELGFNSSSASVFPPTEISGEITLAPEELPNSQKVFPEDIGWISVKEFGAKGDGVTDDTAAILKAMAAPHGDYTRPKILYFPAGTYLVNDTIQYKTGWHSCCVSMQGQGKNKTIIRLQDGAPGFSNPTVPKPVIKTNAGNAAFRNYIRDLTVNVGSDNEGARGIDYVSNNRGSIVNVVIKSEDGSGNAGLAMTRKWPGPSLIKFLSVEGFDYGIHTKHPEYGIVFEHIELKGQQIAGILNEGNALSIRGIKSVNSVPAISNSDQNGLVVVLQGNLVGGQPNIAAIENEGYLYARSIQAEGHKSAIANSNVPIGESIVEEYISHPVYSLFDSPKKSLNLPVEETPIFHDNNLDNWANVKDYPNVQAAMDSGKSTIYFPMGQHRLNETITVPATVKKIVGFESFINLNKKNTKAVISLVEDSTEPLIIEGLWFGNTIIEHSSGRTLAMKHTAFGDTNRIKTFPNSGKLFVEDVQMNLEVGDNQQVWARQINAETLFKPQTKILNSGGELWILGLKTEGKGTVLKTEKQGKTELLGTLVYPVEKFNQIDSQQPAFINKDSQHSLIYTVSSYGKDTNYKIQVEETRNSKTNRLYSETIKDLIIPLYVGY